MSDYIATSADLTSVANAIRAKGGTSAQLAFPADFVQAIGDIQTDGGESEVELGLITEINVTEPVSEIVFTLPTIAESYHVLYATIDLTFEAADYLYVGVATPSDNFLYGGGVIYFPSATSVSGGQVTMTFAPSVQIGDISLIGGKSAYKSGGGTGASGRASASVYNFKACNYAGKKITAGTIKLYGRIA